MKGAQRMAEDRDNEQQIADDIHTLHRLGYAQELARCLGAFSNFAISLSIICILAGGITSFHVGFCSVGGAAIGLGWPLVALFSLAVAASMGQIASAFPTAGGLYHWASILGGRGWGWVTAWFNLAGLITVLAAINVGTFEFANRAFWPDAQPGFTEKFSMVLSMTLSQALINHIGIRLTARLTDLSGYLIFVVALALTIALLVYAPNGDWNRLITFANYGGLPTGEEAIWPANTPIPLLFAFGFLLPAYTITGFDASAHAAEETVGADRRVPRGIVGAVVVSGAAGWIMLCAIVVAIPDMDEAARDGPFVFYRMMQSILPAGLRFALYVGILAAQYLCGLATVTSASRMAFAFARDGGLPFSAYLRHVSPKTRTPVNAIWAVSIAAVLFMIYTPVYETIAAVCAVFLYISYALPIALGMFAYGRSWKRMGPWQLGVCFRPLALLSVIGCVGLLAISIGPNALAMYVVVTVTALLLLSWVLIVRTRFAGPPQGVLDQHRLDEIHAAEDAVRQAAINE
jgi:amino acid transporter